MIKIVKILLSPGKKERELDLLFENGTKVPTTIDAVLDLNDRLKRLGFKKKKVIEK